jgi:hypothetical protein
VTAGGQAEKRLYPGLLEVRNGMLRKHRFTLFSPI